MVICSIYKEDTLISNFDSRQIKKYQTIIDKYGDNDIYICKEAYDSYGRYCPDLYSLHAKRNKNLSEFWDLFRKDVIQLKLKDILEVIGEYERIILISKVNRVANVAYEGNCGEIGDDLNKYMMWTVCKIEYDHIEKAICIYCR